jgi:hypothetical protein
MIDMGSFEKGLYYYWQALWSDKPIVAFVLRQVLSLLLFVK